MIVHFKNYSNFSLLKMENNSDTLYQVARNYDKNILLSEKSNNICCFVSNKWCFEHTEIAAFNEYNPDDNNCCTCLDCCSWCLVFRFKKSCNKKTNCYLCCCSIYFT